MSQFWIKENDRLPYLEKTLVDGSGAAVDLTNATAISFTLLDDNGDAVWTHAATAVAPTTSGRVRYAWGAGETATPGEFRGYFTVTSGGLTQSYPTIGYIDVLIAAQDGSVAGIPAASLSMLRRMVGEIGETAYSDYDLADALTNRALDQNAAAYDIWTLKAAEWANLVNTTEGGQGGSRRDLAQLHDHALKMIDLYASRSAAVQAELAVTTRARVSRTREITRP